MCQKMYDRSIKYNDNRISLMAGQNGKCGVTGNQLYVHAMHCHHKIPLELGGTDDYGNLIWLEENVHRLIHATDQSIIDKYLAILKLSKAALKKVNSLRESAGNSKIVEVAA